MNGRTGSLLDFVELDVSSYLPLPEDYLEDIASLRTRRNMDTITNAQGTRLIEMCKMCNVRILNGTVERDLTHMLASSRVMYITGLVLLIIC